MKGIAFTIDAIFALIIASASISILLYFQFIPQTPYVLKSVDAQNLLNVLMGANVSSLAGSSPIAYAMTNQQSGAGSAWDGYRSQASGQASSSYGPSKPFISTFFSVSNAITTAITADSGNLYFGTGSAVYALNKSGRTLWANGSAQPLTAPLFYNDNIFYATSSKIVDLNANNGSVIWTANAPASPSAQMVGYDGDIFYAGTNNDLYVLYANNGTIESTNALSTGKKAISIAIAKGSIAAESGNALILLTNMPNVVTQGSIWSNTLGSLNTQIAADGNVIAIGTGSTADAFDINGTLLGNSVSQSAISGVATSGSNLVFQNTNTIIDMQPSGTTAWSTAIPSKYGSPLTGTSPVIAQGDVYSLWANNYLIALNLSTGAILWTSKIPYSSLGPNMTVAYGRLYLTAGANVIGYGSCNQNSQTTVLQAAASLYLNGQGSCADYLLNNMETMGNYTVTLGSNVISGLSLASFSPSSNSYIITGSNYSTLYTMTLSFWAYPTAPNAVQQDMVDSIPRYIMVGINSNNDIVLNPGTANSVTTSNAVKFNKWNFIAITAKTSGSSTLYAVYLNGAEVKSGSVSQSVQSPNSLTFSNLTNKYDGLLADVQLYSTTLTGGQLGVIYQEGLQGGPLNNQGLLSWYPLDGDANDYGNQSNAGYSVNVAYINGNYVPQGLLDAYEVGRSSTILYEQNYSSGTTGLYNIGVDAWR